jgi:enoyl-CoA hydratase/carnithine racemase
VAEEVIWEKRGHIRILTFNRPEAMNAQNLEMFKLHGQYFEEFVDDDDAWVLIYTGTGRAFSTGLDLKALKEIFAMKSPAKTLSSPDAPEVWKPVIAAIGGYAVGLGCELALACDIRIAADDARIGLPEVKRAMVPGGGGCQRLPRLVSLGNALMMLFTGDWIEAQDAYRIGLVQKVVPRDKLLDEAIQIAEKICENGPNAVRTVKEEAYRGLEVPLREALAQNRLFDLKNRQASAEDIEEGAKAFAEKRNAVFKGR